MAPGASARLGGRSYSSGQNRFRPRGATGWVLARRFFRGRWRISSVLRTGFRPKKGAASTMRWTCAHRSGSSTAGKWELHNSTANIPVRFSQQGTVFPAMGGFPFLEHPDRRQRASSGSVQEMAGEAAFSRRREVVGGIVDTRRRKGEQGQRLGDFHR